MARDKLTYKIDADSTGFRAELKKASIAYDRFGQKHSRVLSGLKSAGVGAATGIAALGAAATTAGVALSAKATKAAAGFESAIISAGAKSDATAAQLAQMGESALDAAAGTEFSAHQAADAMGFLAAAGFDVAEQMAAVPSVLALASAGELELAESADIASNVLSGFALKVEELGRVNDVLVKAANSSNTSVRQLGEALSFAAPVAAGAGVSIEETVAVIGKLSDAGIQAGRAGTSFTQIMIQLRKAAKKLGVTLTGADIASLGFVGSLKKLEAAGLNAQNAGEFFTARAQVGLQALLVQGIPAIEGLDQALSSAGGTAREVADKKLDTLSGAFGQLSARTKDASVVIGQQLSPVVKQAALVVAQLAQELKDNDALLASIRTGFVEATDGASNLVRAVGILTNVFVTFGGVLGESVVVVKALGAAIRGSANASRLATALVTRNFREIYDSAQGLASATGDYNDALLGFGDSTDAANRYGKKFQDTTFKIADGMQDIAAKARAANKEMAGTAKLLGRSSGVASTRSYRGNLGWLSDYAEPRTTSLQSKKPPSSRSRPPTRRTDPLKSDADRLLKMVETPFQKYSQEIEKLDAAVEAGYISMEKYGEIVGALKLQFEPATIQAAKLDKTAADLGKRFESLSSQHFTDTLNASAAAFENNEITAREYAQQLDAISESAEAFVALERDATRLKEALKTPFERGREAVESYKEMLDQGLITTKEFLAASAQVEGSGLARLEDPEFDTMLEKNRAAAEEWAATWERVGERFTSAISNSLGDAFVGLIEGDIERAKDAINGLIVQIGVLVAKSAILGAFGDPTGGGAVAGILGFATGGYVSGPGSATSDSIPARLSNGEYVVKSSAVQHWGVGFMEAINNMRTPAQSRPQRFASGGHVQARSGGGDNIKIVNVIDPAEVESVMAGPAGERVLLNILSRKRDQARRILR